MELTVFQVSSTWREKMTKLIKHTEEMKHKHLKESAPERNVKVEVEMTKV
jgi:hypothetical protein